MIKLNKDLLNDNQDPNSDLPNRIMMPNLHINDLSPINHPSMTPQDHINEVLDPYIKSASAQRLQDLLSQYPTQEQYQPSKKRKVLGAIAGGIVGAGHGPDAGYKLSSEIVDNPYQKALQNWESKFTPLQTSYGLENSSNKNSLDAYKTYMEAQHLQNEDDPNLQGKLAGTKAGASAAAEQPFKVNLENVQQGGRRELEGVRQTGENQRTNLTVNAGRQNTTDTISGANSRNTETQNAETARNNARIAAENARAARERDLRRELANKSSSEARIPVDQQVKARFDAEDQILQGNIPANSLPITEAELDAISIPVTNKDGTVSRIFKSESKVPGNYKGALKIRKAQAAKKADEMINQGFTTRSGKTNSGNIDSEWIDVSGGVEMPDLKTYKFKNAKTGEYLVFKWDANKSPTTADIEAIKTQRDNNTLKVQPPTGILNNLQAINPFSDEGKNINADFFSKIAPNVQAKIADALYAPSDYFANKAKEIPGKSEGGTLPQRIVKKGREVASGVLDPTNLAIGATTALPGGELAVPAYFASTMAASEPSLVREAINKPSFESGADLTLNTLGLAGAAYGVKKGMENYNPTLPVQPPLVISGVPSGPSVKLSSYPTTNITGQKSIGNGSVSDGSVIDVPYTMKTRSEIEGSPEQLALRSARGKDVSPSSGLTVQMPKEAGQYPKTQKQLGTGSGQIVSGPGFTMRPAEVQPPDESVRQGVSDQPIPERNEQTITPTSKDEIINQLKVELPKDIVKEVSPIIKVETPSNPSAYEINRAIDDPRKVEIHNRQIENRILDKLPDTSQPSQPLETPDTTIQKPIENGWLRNQETEALNIMRKGAKGQLSNEIDTVLAERNQAPPKSQLEVKLPGQSQSSSSLKAKFDTAKDGSLQEVQDEYDSQLNRHEIANKTQAPKRSEIRETAELAKQLGKSQEEFVQDMMHHGIFEDWATKASTNVFRDEERGSFSTRPKAYRIKEAASEGRPATYEEVKDDSNDLGRTISAWLDPLPRAIKKFGGGAPEADELARLIQVERTERNRLNGVYSGALIRGEVSSDRLTGTNNLTDEDFGNYRVSDSKGKVITVIPEGTSGANDSKLIQYKNGKIEAAPGYILIPPKPGNLIDVLTDNALPANDQIKSAAIQARRVLDELGRRGEQAGIGMRIGESGTVPFQRMQEGYFPKKYTSSFFDSLSEDPTTNEVMLKSIMVKNNLTRGEAQAYIRNSRKQGEILSAPQHARLANYDAFIRDRSALFNHVQELSHRIGTAETLGPKDVNGPLINGYLDAIAKSGGDEKLVRAFVNRVVGRDETGLFRSAENGVYRAVSSVLTAKYLPLFAISDMATLHNIAMRGTISRVIPAIWRNLTVQDRMRNNIMPTGALSEHLTNDLAPESFFGKLYKVREAESFLRGTAADVGRGTTSDLLEYLKGNSDNPTGYNYKTAYGRLKNLTLKNDLQMSKLLERGKLSNKEINFAGGRMAEMTQGLVDPVDMPYQWSNKNGGLIMDYIFTYKRFAYQSSKLLLESIKENPTKTIPMLLATAPVVGELLGDTKEALKGVLHGLISDSSVANSIIRNIEGRGQLNTNFTKNHPLISRYLADLSQSWALGLMADTATAISDGTSGLSEFVTGPAVSLAGDIASHVANLWKDLIHEPSIDWDKMETDFVKMGTLSLPSPVESELNKDLKKPITVDNPNRVERPSRISH